ncbi:24346_t:CDS:2 [Racocetra persica]|uniref:24346_t:CDS:1 n=1 Tax=Racocetra persica TaxID=160502 RepID=A0ACA9RUF4_9GLOM|nr:24346_t:CDS:2 [Racocetra persica]
MGKIRKKELKAKNTTSLLEEEIFKLVASDYTREVKEFIKDNPHLKLVLVNYPHNEQQLASLSAELAQTGKKINNIILLSITNYELILSLKEEYLICPICEKIYNRKEVVKENEKFVCPRDSEYQLSLVATKKYSDYIIEYYLKNTELVIKKFLTTNKLLPSSVIQLTVQKKEEILAGEIQKNLLKVIDNLEKNKLEKERDKALSKLLQSIIDWEVFGGSERKKALEEYKKVMADIKVIQQHLELELAGEVADKAEF